MILYNLSALYQIHFFESMYMWLAKDYNYNLMKIIHAADLQFYNLRSIDYRRISHYLAFFSEHEQMETLFLHQYHSLLVNSQ